MISKKVTLKVLIRSYRVSWLHSKFVALSITFFLLSANAILAKDDKACYDSTFFNGKDLAGWTSSNMKYWNVDGGAIVGHASDVIEKNEFLWSDVEVEDFYLCIDVMLVPEDRNAGIQFRSKKADEYGQAIGYQADVGREFWGRLYHEHGRGKLDWTDLGEKEVLPGKWNRYEILAVGHRIWMAINGTLSVAVEDPDGELTGYIALQLHSGKPQTVKYRIIRLVHNPKVELAGLNESQLDKQLKAPLDPLLNSE